ncbi:protein YgfX [Sedimenticola selenatireducens]|uniref:protein YgfX n=1 Tax=Sedimenticola selenatireducens TaxID=191960 RepID=UPI0004903B9F|nr:protein YgfX [Sedimenticola selenatireducens]
MNREQAPLRIRLHQSKILILYRHLLHAVLIAYSVVAAVSYPLEMLLPIAWLVVSWYLLYQKIRYRAGEQSTIVWRPDGSWLIERENGATQYYPALHSCFSIHRLTILGFRKGYFSRRYYLLLVDNCDPEQHRRLRVHLKLRISQQDSRVDNYSVSGQ